MTTAVNDQTFTLSALDASPNSSTEVYDDLGLGKLILTHDGFLHDEEEDSEGDLEDIMIISRYRTSYCTTIERTWVEVDELYKAGRYDQALVAFEAGHGAGSGATYLLDKEVEQRSKIKAQISLKAMTSTTDIILQKTIYDETVADLFNAIFLRGRMQFELQDFLWRVLEKRAHQLIPRGGVCDYSNIPTDQLVEAGNVWLTWFELWSDYYVTLTGSFPTDKQRPHECLQRIGSELANRNELLLSRKLMQRAVVSVPITSGGATWMHMYLAIEAECAEALFDMNAANAAYGTIQLYQNRSKDLFCYDAEGSFGYTKCALPGSLDERIERTTKIVDADYWSLDELVTGETWAEF